MATRNLTKRFNDLRASFRHPKSSSHKSDGRQTLLSGDSASDDNTVQYVLPPKWVDIVESVQRDVSTIKDLVAQLQEKHGLRLRVSFGDDEAEIDRDIDVMTGRIAQLLRKCQNGIKRVATVANDRGGALPERERMVRLNVMRSLGAELEVLSKKFRGTQKQYLMRMRGQEEVGKQFFDESANQAITAFSSDDLDRGLSEQEMAALEEMNENATQREQEIIQIAKSINELASLFNELSVLVVEQGTVLDRIDYNVEQTLVKVQEGVVEIQKADDYSKGARTMKCIFVLIIIIIILTAILVFKHTSFNGGGGDDSSS